jgi:antitoxin component YwqK of YwqJK toxin-antitoxin module
MRCKSIRRLIGLAVLIAPTQLCNSQAADWQPMLREIVVSYDDSLVRANILIRNENITTSNQLMYYWYNQNRISKNMGGFAGALLHGPYLVYNKDKNLITQGSFDKGLMNGVWKYWDTNGIIEKSVEYKNGLLDGDYKIYDMHGELLEIHKYKAGKLQVETEGNRMKIWKAGDKEENDTITNKNY